MQPEQVPSDMNRLLDLLDAALAGDSQDFSEAMIDQILNDGELQLRALPMISEVILKRRILGEREREIRNYLMQHLKVSKLRAEDLMNLASLAGSEAADILDGIQDHQTGEDILVNLYDINPLLARALLSTAIRVYLRSFFDDNGGLGLNLEQNQFLSGLGKDRSRILNRLNLAFYVRTNLRNGKRLSVIRAVLEEHHLLGGDDVDAFLLHVTTAYEASERIAAGAEGVDVFLQLGIQDMPVEVIIFTLKFLERHE
ncbi:MAG: hypothetical protein D6820_05785 [Lentisphaerae bacterium]|nr:MAG: hypothetical protein D6820_05785 [Lentisphaerota bacterium]